jgi:hypothetical protein
MSREIRRVPPGWQHPKNDGPHGNGRYIPLFHDYEKAVAEWDDGRDRWLAGTYRDQKPDAPRTEAAFAAYSGARPVKGDYAAYTAEEATHYQVYETVSEGTPVSPVFATTAELADWLVTQGHSRENADAFVRTGFVPSATQVAGQYYEGIDAAAVFEGRYFKQRQEVR